MSGTPGRLLSWLSLLQARRDWPGNLLAARLEVSDRTVRRDIDRLRQLGYPVRAAMGPAGGYRLGAGADLPPLLFDDEQAVALAVALQLAATTGAGIADAAWRALGTVRQVMPARLRRRVDAVEVLTMPRAGAAEVNMAVLLAVTDARRATSSCGSTTGPPDRSRPRRWAHRVGWSRTTCCTELAGGTCWRGIWNVPTGAPSASTGSARGHRRARASPRGRSRVQS